MTDVLPSRCSPEVGARTTAPAPTCRPVSCATDLAAHRAVRRAVFVDEQHLFAPDDLDAHDGGAATVHVLGLIDGGPAGAVRLYPLGGGLWKGDRLAVLRPYRRSGIGAPLVRLAVQTAGALGGARMVAQVQAVNTAFFRELGWTCEGAPADHLGVPHQQMSIALR